MLYNFPKFVSSRDSFVSSLFSWNPDPKQHSFSKYPNCISGKILNFH